jgi:hypothetical protein
VARSCCIALLLLACSTVSPRGGPPTDAALIRPARELSRQVLIRAIDGREPGWLRGPTRVSPGRHRIDVTVVIEVGGRDLFAAHELEIEAEPGAEYSLHAEWARFGPAVVLRDARTRARVAAAEPLPPVGSARAGRVP